MMNCIIKQISCMPKVRSSSDMDCREIKHAFAVKGQRFCYQIAFSSAECIDLGIEVISPLKEHIKLYTVDNAVMDMPVSPLYSDSDFITRSPGVMPDILTPVNSCDFPLHIVNSARALWIDVNIPKDLNSGSYNIDILITESDMVSGDKQTKTCSLGIDVIDAELPDAEVIYTQWFHGDCIADIHHVEIYSEEHWKYIDAYMKTAVDLGINMLLTPVLSSSLDVAVGVVRPCTQLLDITKSGSKYSFGFEKLKRWISLCQKNGIEYFEISHLFSQAGLKYSPCIKVIENGKESLAFGWHVPAHDSSYKEFLEQMLPKLMTFLENEGVAGKCIFHISDEPTKEHLEAYRYAHSIVKPLIGNCMIMDAISDVSFYENGFIDCPVTAIDHIDEFLDKKVQHQWAYNCCVQHVKTSNRFMSMPAYRNRIIGLQMYKYDIKGFLHWGYNFYNSQYSRYKINPYITTSSDMAFPSGDPFSVYPSADGPLASTRARIFFLALQDIRICKLLEKHIGKQAVIDLIESEAGMEISFTQYPRNSDFLPDISEKLISELKKYI